MGDLLPAFRRIKKTQSVLPALAVSQATLIQNNMPILGWQPSALPQRFLQKLASCCRPINHKSLFIFFFFAYLTAIIGPTAYFLLCQEILPPIGHKPTLFKLQGVFPRCRVNMCLLTSGSQFLSLFTLTLYRHHSNPFLLPQTPLMS